MKITKLKTFVLGSGWRNMILLRQARFLRLATKLLPMYLGYMMIETDDRDILRKKFVEKNYSPEIHFVLPSLGLWLSDGAGPLIKVFYSSLSSIHA